MKLIEKILKALQTIQSLLKKKFNKSRKLQAVACYDIVKISYDLFQSLKVHGIFRIKNV